MKNKYVSTRIMAMVMAAAMTVSAAPAVYAAERADSETIKEDNQPAAEDSTESADTEDSSAEATKTEYPLTITPMITMETKSKPLMKKHRKKSLLYIREALRLCSHLVWKTTW